MTMPFRSFACHGLLLCLLVISITSGGFSQIPSGLGGLPNQDYGSEKLFGKVSLQNIQSGDMFFEGPINPDEYIVGPGDKLSLVFWQPSYVEYPCVVSAEGTVSVPMVGFVSVANLSLTQAKACIEKQVTENLRIGRLSVSLTSPRSFRIHVAGLVEMPGTYVVPATARVADAVLLAGGFKAQTMLFGSDSSRAIQSSLRRIELRDSEGRKVNKADLLLFQRGGRLDANPILHDGQTIFIPYPEYGRDQIGIFGGVHQNGLFEYVSGDCIGDAIILAGGLTSQVDSSSIVVISRTGDKRTALDLCGSKGETALKYELFAGDRVYISEKTDTSHVGSVTIKGEVARPGGYPIIKGQTNLRQLIETAGGFLPKAAVNSARLIRQETQNLIGPERDRIFAELLKPNVTTAFTSDIGIEAELRRWDYGTVVVDLSKITDSKSKDGDLLLHDGDVLEIPSSPLGVRVLGFVNHAGEVEWKPGEKLEYYLTAADGINTAGWQNRTVIIKAKNGSQLRYQTSLPIDPGDVIYVPSKPETTNWTLFKDVVGVVAQVATLVLIGQNIGK